MTLLNYHWKVWFLYLPKIRNTDIKSEKNRKHHNMFLNFKDDQRSYKHIIV